MEIKSLAKFCIFWKYSTRSMKNIIPLKKEIILKKLMSNRADSRKHGMHRIERIRAKKKFRVRKKRPEMKARQDARQEAISTAMAEFSVAA